MNRTETRSHLKPLDSPPDVRFLSWRSATITHTHAQFTLWSPIASRRIAWSAISLQGLATIPAPSVNGPDTWRGKFEQMTIGIAKIEAPSAQFPGAFFFHCNSLLGEPSFPGSQFRGWNGKCDVQFAVAIVRRCDSARGSFFEQQRYLAWTRVHRATALTKVADDWKSKNFLIETDRAR